MSKNAPILGLLLLMLVGCGGSNGGSGSSNTGGGGSSGSTTGDAQGVYSGTASNGYSFSTIVLPNDKFYEIYGTTIGNEFLIDGMITGQGTSGSSTYTAGVTDFYYTGLINSGSVSGSYVAGTSLNGTLTESGTSTTYTATSLPASSFNYNTSASVSAISGTWTGDLLNGEAATVTINSNGNVTGSSSGCSFSGTVAADSSNKNFFDVSLTFGASPCLLPNSTASGIGIDYLLSDGVTQQLLAAVTEGTSAGTVFAAERSSSTSPSITISPKSASVNAGGTVQFTATVSNLANNLVTWQVNGITSGNSTFGTIDINGLYTAPATEPTNNIVTITAIAQAQTTLTATAMITILPPAAISAIACLDANTNQPSQTVAPGDSLVCTPTVAGGGNIAVNWFVNNSPTCSSTFGAPNGAVPVGGVNTYPYGQVFPAGNQMNFAPPLVPPPGGVVTITAQSQATLTQTLCVPVTLTFGTASLQGSYAFSTSGRIVSTNAFFGRAGSFTADGSGHIIGGHEDINPQPSNITSPAPISFSGTYSIGPDGRGTMAFCEPSTSNACSSPTSQFRIVVLSNQQAQIIEFSPPNSVSATTAASGEIDLVSSSSFTSGSLLGTYVFNFAGFSTAAAAQSEVGEFTANGVGGAGGITSGEIDVNAGGEQTILGTSSYSIVSNGRGTASIVTSRGTSNFAFYMVSANRAKFVETDASPVLVGDAVSQQSLFSFGLGSLNGAYVFETGGSGASGTITDLVSFTSNGSGGIAAGSGMIDDNNAGTVTSLSSLNGSYTLDATGRGTLTIGTHTYVFYMVSTSNAMIQETTSGIVTHGSLLQPQGGPFSLASLRTSFALYLFGTDAAGKAEDFVGQLTSNGTGTLTFGSLDVNDFGVTLTGGSNIGTYATIAANGRTTMQLTRPQNLVLYFVSPTQLFAIVGTDSNHTVADGSLYKQY